MRTLDLSCFETFPVLRTERLLLRALVPEDIPMLFEMRQNPRNNTFIYRPPMKGPKAAKDLYHKIDKAWREKEAIAWAAVLRDQGEIIGCCGFNRIMPDYLRAEIGGELNIKYWGKGLPLEAVEEIIRFGFEGMGLHAIEAKVSPENRGAVAILENMGFLKEAHFRDYGYFGGKFRDMSVYTLFEPT